MEPLELVALDTETTGLFPAQDRLTEIALIRFRLDGSVLWRWESLVRPGVAIPPVVTELTGITDELVAGAPPARNVLAEAFARCGGADFLVAHNAPFDASFLRAEADRAGLELPAVPFLDTVRLTRLLPQVFPDHKLPTLATRLGFPGGFHRAAGDAEHVRRLLLHVVQELPWLSRREMLERKGGGAWAACAPLPIPPALEELDDHARHQRPLTVRYDDGTGVEAAQDVIPRGLLATGEGLVLVADRWGTGQQVRLPVDRIRHYRLKGASG